MSTIADRLRILAAEIDADTGRLGLVLVPLAANLVQVGDIALFTTDERVKVTQIKTTDKHSSRGYVLISFEGEVIDAGEFQPRFANLFANEWMVVER